MSVRELLEESLDTVTIVIPTYNEAETIVDVVSQLTLVLVAETPFDYEVIVVDDDSPDWTWEIVDDHFRTDPDVRVVRRIGERGLATAVLDGFGKAEGDILVVMDADGQHPPENVPDLLIPFSHEDVDVVVGSRFIDGGGIDGWTRSRQLISRAGTLLAELSVGRAWRISDPMSGFFAVRRNLIDDRLGALTPTGYKILLEVLATCDPELVIEVPYVFEERRAGESKLDGRETLRFLSHSLSMSADDVDVVDAALVSVGALFLLANPIPLVISIGIFAVAALRAATRSGRDLGEQLSSIDVQRWRYEQDMFRGDPYIIMEEVR